MAGGFSGLSGDEQSRRVASVPSVITLVRFAPAIITRGGRLRSREQARGSGSLDEEPLDAPPAFAGIVSGCAHTCRVLAQSDDPSPFGACLETPSVCGAQHDLYVGALLKRCHAKRFTESLQHAPCRRYNRWTIESPRLSKDVLNRRSIERAL